MFRKRQPGASDPQLRRLHLHATQLIQSKRHDLAEGILRQILAMNPYQRRVRAAVEGML